MENQATENRRARLHGRVVLAAVAGCAVLGTALMLLPPGADGGPLALPCPGCPGAVGGGRRGAGRAARPGGADR
ncbi:UNVERIFIED_CONTAM: hypothetical protein RKD50_003866 [Streptomyces canus]